MKINNHYFLSLPFRSMLNKLSFSRNKLISGSVRHFCASKMSPNPCKVAVCQFTATNNKANNLVTVKKLITEAAKKNAKVIFLPEACDFIGSNAEDSKILAEPVTGLLMSEYKSLAHDLNVWLSVGGFHELVHGENGTSKVYNSHVLIDSNGDIIANYRKIHLFDVSIPERNILLKESDVIQKGCDVVPPVDTPAGKMALSICYDLRFPELSIIQRKQGAIILTFPSAFTRATGMVHWEVLVRARAIENQCYVIAAAQYGKHNERRLSWGQSMIVDPWGKIIAECPKYTDGKEDVNESIAYATLDAKIPDNIRVEMPVLQHRRDDIYQLNQVKHATSLQIDDAENFHFADKIIPGATVFYRTRLSYAFTNIRCVVPGRILFLLSSDDVVLGSIAIVQKNFFEKCLPDFRMQKSVIVRDLHHSSE